MSELKRAYIYDPKSFRDLLEPKMAAAITNLSVERLMEFAKTGFAPCIIVDETKYLFQRKDIQTWVRENLVKHQGGKNFEFTVYSDANAAADPADIPEELVPIAHRLRSLKDGFEIPCIYFLIALNKVVYVGQSTKLFARLLQHRADKDFDRVLYFHYPKEGLSEIESSFIRFLRPKYNIMEGKSELGAGHMKNLKGVGYYECEEKSFGR